MTDTKPIKGSENFAELHRQLHEQLLARWVIPAKYLGEPSPYSSAKASEQMWLKKQGVVQ